MTKIIFAGKFSQRVVGKGAAFELERMEHAESLPDVRPVASPAMEAFKRRYGASTYAEYLERRGKDPRYSHRMCYPKISSQR